MDTLISSHWLGSLGGTVASLAPAGPFVLAGIEWGNPRRARIELRTRRVDGGWGPWALASVQGHDSDGGEAASHASFGEPLWTGLSSELQLRSDRRVEGLTVHLVSGDVLEQAATGEPLAQPVLPAGPGQPPIIARRAWAGNRGPAAPPIYGDVRMMFVHHSDNPNGYSAGDVPGMLLSIYEFHRYVRGWNDIGYNFVIDAYGRIWEARDGGIDQAVVGAQAGGYNVESSGVVMLGTFSGVLPTPAALASLGRLLAWKLSLHGVPVSGVSTVEVDPSDAFYTAFRPGQRVELPRIAGHRDGCTTDCPGDDLYGHLPVVRSAVRQLSGTQLALNLDFATGQHTAGATYLSLASARLLAGEPLALVGRLTQMSSLGAVGAPVSGASIEIQSLSGQTEATLTAPTPAGTPGPVTVSTGAEGRFSAEIRPMHNLLVRALRAESKAVASPLLAIGVAPVITLESDSTAPGPLTLIGTVTPPKAKLTVNIYTAGGAHRLVHTETLDVPVDGRFRFRPRLKAGSYWLRAVSAADAGNIAGESPRISFTV